jgi:hypothetical protein
MASPTVIAIAILVNQLTGRDMRSMTEGPSAITDDQVAGIAASIASVLTPDQVFPAAGITQLISARDDIYSAAEAIVYASASTPALVFTGAGGVSKLQAWATANGWTHA